MIESASMEHRPREIAGARIDRPYLIAKGEWRLLLYQIHMGLEKGADGSDVPPVALEEVCLYAPARNLGRNDVTTEIRQRVVQRFDARYG